MSIPVDLSDREALIKAAVTYVDYLHSIKCSYTVIVLQVVLGSFPLDVVPA